MSIPNSLLTTLAASTQPWPPIPVSTVKRPCPARSSVDALPPWPSCTQTLHFQDCSASPPTQVEPARACALLQRCAIGRDGLLETRRPALTLAKCQKRIAKTMLGRRPVERVPLACPLFQRRAVGRDRLLEPRSPALKLA